MADRGRLLYTPGEWFAWYRDIVGWINADSGFAPAEVLARWAAMAAPAYDPLGLPPRPEVLAAAPKYKYIEAEGSWWVRDDNATDKPARAGISWDLVGPFLRTPEGELIRDRERAKRRLAHLANDPTIAMLLRMFLTGRQDDKRSTLSAPVLARALVILGLRDAGLSHQAAIRMWLRWECELDGPLAAPGMLATLQLDRRADLYALDCLKSFGQQIALSNRRTWIALWGRLPEFASPESH